MLLPLISIEDIFPNSLTRKSHFLYTMILQWGNFNKAHLPMGIYGSLDIFQQRMLDLRYHVEIVWVYLDDLLLTKSDIFKHLLYLKKVLKHI